MNVNWTRTDKVLVMSTTYGPILNVLVLIWQHSLLPVVMAACKADVEKGDEAHMWLKT